jgi:hypothetical protein
MDEDRSLHEHADDSEITLNICLGKEFTGGELYWHGQVGQPDNDTVPRFISTSLSQAT